MWRLNIWAASVLALTGGGLFDRLAELDLRSPWALLALVLLYVPASLALLPVWPLTISAGFLFGVPLGMPAALVGLILGATAGFSAGRRFARSPAVRRIADRPFLAALDEAVQRRAVAIVILTRLSPLVPYNVLNYLYGMTGVSLRSFALGSGLGMLPGTLLYVSMGTQAQNLVDIWQGRVTAGPAGIGLLVGGIIATLAASVIIGIAARRALRARLPKPPA
ncbi:MAG TPA: VTT domain-containing protein [Pirellulales bacterium]|nr:VTT domain-containing protein [Pirellulales bacterium]